MKLGVGIGIKIVLCAISLASSEVSTSNPCDDAKDEIPCDDGRCIARVQWCDSEEHCDDGSDEKYCAVANRWFGLRNVNNCDNDTHFICSKGPCFPKTVYCDGTQDCDGGDDEANCMSKMITTSIQSESTFEETSTMESSEEDDDYDDYDDSKSTIQENPSTTTTVAPPNQNVENKNTGIENNTVSLKKDADVKPVMSNKSIHHRFRHPQSNHMRNRFVLSVNNGDKERKPKEFVFKTNLTAEYESKNRLGIRAAEKWLLSKRDKYGGWDEDTPKALIALSLITNTFPISSEDNDLMRKNFEVYLSAKILRNSTSTMSPNQLSSFILAALATCHNPRDFQGRDLTQSLLDSVDRLHRTGQAAPFVNPLVPLALCLADRPLSPREYSTLMKHMLPTHVKDEISKDMQGLAVLAYACLMHSQKDIVHRSAHASLMESVPQMLRRMNKDGSFGSVYSTAIAAQALLSLDSTPSWNPSLTLEYLASQQRSDGSFGDMLATYLVLPVLSGRGLVHLRNTLCDQPCPGSNIAATQKIKGKYFVQYSLYFGKPLLSSDSIQLLVPSGTSFFDIMKMAEHQNSNFRFSYDEAAEGPYVYSIANVPNDFEQGLQWHVYRKAAAHRDQKNLRPRELYSGDIRQLYPKTEEHVIFWYHPTAIRAA